MDALAVAQYRHLLTACAVGLGVLLVAALVLARRPAPPLEPAAPASDAERREVLPHVMLLLVTLAVGAGVLLVLPAAMILKYIPGTPVVVLVVSCVALLATPLVYAWRARPF